MFIVFLISFIIYLCFYYIRIIFIPSFFSVSVSGSFFFYIQMNEP
jgi:hypothetical protein